MKKVSLFLSALTVAGFVSCADDVTTSETEQSYSVTFHTSGWSVRQESFTRADLTDENMTDLWVCDNGEVIAHQASTDADFGSPTVELAFGQHSLSFIATRATGNTITDGVFSCQSVLPTFGKVVNLSVDKNTTAQDIELSRLVYCLRYTIEDAIPTNANTASLTIAQHYAKLDVTTLSASGVANPLKKDWSVTSLIGQTGISLSAYGFCPTLNTEYTTATSATFYDADNAVISSASNADVPLLTNRITTIHGNMFGTANASRISLNATWNEPKEIAL